MILQAAQLEMNSRTRLLSIPVTIDMVPSAKIVVFYITPDGQIIADSLVYHVDATKGGKVRNVVASCDELYRSIQPEIF